MDTKTRIRQLALNDRPREKMLQKGVAALSDFELLEVLIGSGAGKTDVGFIARQVQRLLLNGTTNISYEALTAIKGVNIATASKILAALEVAQRYLVKDIEPIRSQQDVLARLDTIRDKKQEHCICLSLDGGQRLIAVRTVTIGTLDSLITHPREVFANAITDRAACIILAHNHPSRDVSPSKQDIAITQQLSAAGQMLGIPLRDHVIVTRTDHFSFEQHHYL